jgi:Protein of unknown function (DUF2892)
MHGLKSTIHEGFPVHARDGEELGRVLVKNERSFTVESGDPAPSHPGLYEVKYDDIADVRGASVTLLVRRQDLVTSPMTDRAKTPSIGLGLDEEPAVRVGPSGDPLGPYPTPPAVDRSLRRNMSTPKSEHADARSAHTRARLSSGAPSPVTVRNRRPMKGNVGGFDRTLRWIAGPSLLAGGYFFLGGNRGRLPGIAAMLGGVGLLETAITRTCPINALFGIDTRAR